MARRLLKKKILLAIPTFQDPHVPGRKDGFGPILQALQKGNFDEVILFGLQMWRLNTFLTEQFISKNYPNITVKRHILPLQDLSCYKDIFYQLKTKLEEYEFYLQKNSEEPVFLLPSSIYEYLFDCWLLLSTSLNMKTRICQIASHYALEGTPSSDIDWLSEPPKEFHDSHTEAQIICQYLSKNQIHFLEKISEKHQNFCIITENSNIHQSIAQFFSQLARTKNLNYLNIACPQIPSEIANEILFGYQKQIENDKILKRKGLLKKFNKGLISLENINILSNEINKKIQTFIMHQKHSRFISICPTIKDLSSAIPYFPLPLN